MTKCRGQPHLTKDRPGSAVSALRLLYTCSLPASCSGAQRGMRNQKVSKHTDGCWFCQDFILHFSPGGAHSTRAMRVGLSKLVVPLAHLSIPRRVPAFSLTQGAALVRRSQRIYQERGFSEMSAVSSVRNVVVIVAMEGDMCAVLVRVLVGSVENLRGHCTHTIRTTCCTATVLL